MQSDRSSRSSNRRDGALGVGHVLGVLLAFTSTLFCFSVFAQELDPVEAAADQAADEPAPQKGNLVWAPIPVLEPALGGGVVLVGMYFYPHAEDEPANITAVAAGYTSTDSYLIGAAHDHHFKGNRWRFQGAVGYAELNLNWYGIGSEGGDQGTSFQYSIKGTFVEPRLLRKFSKGWSIGADVQFLDLEVDFDDGEPGDPILDAVTEAMLDLKSMGVGLLGRKDTRDNRFAPYEGRYAQLSAMGFPGALDNDLDYRIYKGFYNQYWPVRKETVLAANVSSQYADGQVPFYRLSKLTIRGVSADRYWDKFLVQGQAEVRHQIQGRWSAAAFAGYGGVAPSLNKLESDDMILAGGAGIRFMVDRKERVALRLDVAKGQDQTMVYIGVGEFF